jgi:hypothetical protein
MDDRSGRSVARERLFNVDRGRFALGDLWLLLCETEQRYLLPEI